MRPTPALSVIIPTYNGGWVLRRTLDALMRQNAPADSFEVIVVDDGSTDGSTQGLDAAGPVAVRILRDKNRGRAAARNAGAAVALGRALLFLDSDIWAAPNLVSVHLSHHAERSNLGVQGRWTDHADSLVSLFMRARSAFPDVTVRRREGLSPYHVVTRNFSIDADAFKRAGGFDERFSGYGWEDIELAFRMVRQGVMLRFDPAAYGDHYHIQTLEEAIDKSKQAGEGAVYFWEKHNRNLHLGLFLEIQPVLLPLKWFIYRSGLFTALLRPLMGFAERRGLTLVAGEVYNHLVWRGFYEGVFAARRRTRSANVRGVGAANRDTAAADQPEARP
jgi:glycosyltransferase involved in cell wall biosynthesis